MKRNILNALAVSLIAVLCLGFFVNTAHAEGDESAEDPTNENITGTSIRLSPANFIVDLPPDSTIEDSFEVKNEGDSDIKVEIHANPYFYTYSEEDGQYKLGFNNENSFTQLARWITFEDQSGVFVGKPTYTIKANEKLNIKYQIKTPTDMPGGGQYAVIFVHALTSVTSSNGIRTEASPGIVVYGHATEGERKVSPAISGLKIEKGITENNTTRNNIYATARVKNNGNIDFVATGTLKVDPIIGFTAFEEPEPVKVSIIPETEMTVFKEWENTPSFGIYKVTWAVSSGDQIETVERIFFLFSPIVLIGVIILLTFITIWIIVVVRKRKARRSRLTV